MKRLWKVAVVLISISWVVFLTIRAECPSTSHVDRPLAVGELLVTVPANVGVTIHPLYSKSSASLRSTSHVIGYGLEATHEEVPHGLLRIEPLPLNVGKANEDDAVRSYDDLVPGVQAKYPVKEWGRTPDSLRFGALRGYGAEWQTSDGIRIMFATVFTDKEIYSILCKVPGKPSPRQTDGVRRLEALLHSLRVATG